eukprot:c23958_g1_i1.p1 GENE.c23958_g1_i1~~c23958_g1_i1.p1  ORF type:complete len:219 (-),score=42.07 c23958_g1_i1:209-865(-)
MVVCVECGAGVDSLAVETHGEVHVVRCHQCGHLADKYIEMESLFVLFDILLLRHSAFAHIVHNARMEFRFFALGSVLMGTYLKVTLYCDGNCKFFGTPIERSLERHSKHLAYTLLAAILEIFGFAILLYLTILAFGGKEKFEGSKSSGNQPSPEKRIFFKRPTGIWHIVWTVIGVGGFVRLVLGAVMLVWSDNNWKPLLKAMFAMEMCIITCQTAVIR